MRNNKTPRGLQIRKGLAVLASLCGLLTLMPHAARAQQARPLLHEDFESAGGVLGRTELNDIYHAGGVDKNIVIGQAAGGGRSANGGNALHWLRKDSGYYYARPQRTLASGTGRVAVSYRVNFEASNPYWWIFSLIDPTYKVEYVQLFSGLGYQGNVLYSAYGRLVYVNPDGSWRTLCAIQPGWRQLKLIVDFNTGRATVFYDDMRVPVASDVPLLHRPPAPISPFRPMFHGFSSAGEGGFWLDDLLMEDLPAQTPAPRQRDSGAGGADLQLAQAGAQMRVSRRTGALAGFAANGKPLLDGSDDSYTFQNRTQAIFAREHDDRVQSSQAQENRITLTCANPALRGVTIRKTYVLSANGEASRRVEFTSETQEGFIAHRLKLTLNPDFAAQSFPLGFRFLTGLQPGEYSALRGTPCLIRSNSSQGLGLYRARVNDRFVLPDMETQGGTEEWDCAVFQDYASRGKPVSGETRWFAFTGDASVYERRLTGQAEYRKLFDRARPAWLDTLASDAMFTSTGILDYIKAAAPLPVSSAIWFLNPPWGNWWSYSDPPLKLDAHVREIAPGFRGNAPNARVSAYANELFDRNSDVFKTHPEFGVTNKAGGLTDAGVSSDAGKAPTYYLQIRSKAARDYYQAMYLERVKNWKLDFLYLDGPGALHTEPDWKLNVVVQSYDWIDFYRELKERLTVQSPAAAFWSNGFLPYSDIGYLEWRDPQWQEIAGGANWRYYAFNLWLNKLRQPPGYLIVPLYGDAGAQPAISAYSIAYGWVSQGAVPGYLPWQIAALETRDTALVQNGVTPRWQQDGGLVEAWAGKKDANVLVNVISHGDNPSAHITLDTRESGLEQGKSYLLRVLAMNPPTDKPGSKTAQPGQAGSGEGQPRAFTTRNMRRIQINGASLPLDVPTQKGRLTTVILSPTMALMEHNGAQPSETGLTDTYAAQLKSLRVADGQTEYALTCKYANATLFFPYAAHADASPSVARATTATVNGVSGVRVTTLQAGNHIVKVR